MKPTRDDLMLMKLANPEEFNLLSAQIGFVGGIFTFAGYALDATTVDGEGFRGSLFHNNLRFYGVHTAHNSQPLDHRLSDEGYSITRPWVIWMYGEDDQVVYFSRYTTESARQSVLDSLLSNGTSSDVFEQHKWFWWF